MPPPVWAQSDNLTRSHHELLYTVVQVTAGSARDSGSVIHSENHGDQYETFVLTNFHVVGSAVTVEVSWHQYNDLSAFIGASSKTAKIVVYDRAADSALQGFKEIAVR